MIRLETSAKDDFYNMVRKFTLDKLLSYVKVDKDGAYYIPQKDLTAVDDALFPEDSL